MGFDGCLSTLGEFCTFGYFMLCHKNIKTCLAVMLGFITKTLIFDAKNLFKGNKIMKLKDFLYPYLFLTPKSCSNFEL